MDKKTIYYIIEEFHGSGEEELIFYTKEFEDLLYQPGGIEDIDDFISQKGKKRFKELQKEVFDYYDSIYNKWYQEEAKGINIKKKYNLSESEYENYEILIIKDDYFMDTFFDDINIDIYYPTQNDILYESLPQEIIDKFLNTETNYHGQEFHSIDINKLDEVIDDLKKMGYKVVKK
tara:strand:+ start:1082 stop:1609 length:528 start_codon:yes stop_codon:yes gene_type:complete